ncbi:MAG TPA: PilZ domain-containing protein [Acidobacteriota bacterium]|nr:PilZ domain-containing protein [Acidobacteriota bacterium]
MGPEKTVAMEELDTQRRKDRRIKQWNKASIRALGEGPGRGGLGEAEAFTYDLSLGGARVHSRELYEVGTPVRLRMELVRSSETVAIDGVIKWARQSQADGVYEMGVEFRHTSQQTILSLMKNLHDNKR